MRWFVTGTDTGVGKTAVSGDLVAGICAAGRRAGYLKPVETGVEMPEDECHVRARAPRAICRTPILLPEPLAPAVAARRAGVSIDLAVLDRELDALSRQVDDLIVEGAGGLLVPLTDRETFADLAQRWTLPVVVVVANRLGCVNHAWLTVRECERRGLPVAGWILNEIEPERTVAMETNLETLSRLLGPPAAIRDRGTPAELDPVELFS